MFACFLLTAGVRADRFGRRTTFIIGLTLFAVSSDAAGCANTAWMLNPSRGVQGLGAAFMLSSSGALLAQIFPGPDRTRAFELIGGASFNWNCRQTSQHLPKARFLLALHRLCGIDSAPPGDRTIDKLDRAKQGGKSGIQGYTNACQRQNGWICYSPFDGRNERPINLSINS